MANRVLLKAGTQICFADHAGDFSPATGTDLRVGTPTTVQMAVAGLANGAARASTKFDFGAVWARQYSLMGALEFFSAPTAGGKIDYYIAPSPQSTAANGNAGKVSGTDGAYTGDGGGTVAESVRGMQWIGALVVTDLVGVQVLHSQEPFTPLQRYGSLVIVSDVSVNLANTDDVETHVVLTPLEDEIQ